MKRIIAIAASGLSLAACSSMPSWMQPNAAPPAPAATTMQFESEPAGAEARTSFGQSCRTPCSVTVTGTEFTVSFSLPGYQPQTVPVRMTGASEENQNAPGEAEGGTPRLVPNPVFVELRRVGPPPAARKKPAAKRPSTASPAAAAKPASPAKPAAKPALRPAAPPPAPAPEAAPASPWPPPPPSR